MKAIRNFAVAALIAAVACGGGGDIPAVTGTTGGNPGGGTPTGGSDSPQATNAVTVSDNIFTPTNIVVTAGTTVTWTWAAGSAAHNVTFADGAQSGDKTGGATYTRTFSTVGTFNYSCTIHPGMNGSVKVQ
jgi:plastocyanin